MPDEIHHLVEEIESLRAQNAALVQALCKRSPALHVGIEDNSEQPVLINHWRPDNILTYVNDAYCRYIGKTREELVGRDFTLRYREPTREYVRNLVIHTLAKMTPEHPTVINDHWSVNGREEPRFLRWVATGIFNENQKLVEIYSHGHDLTNRKLIEESMFDSERRYRSLIDTAGSVIISLDLNHCITEWNLQSERVSGYVREEVIGKDYLRLFVAPESRNALEAEFKKVAAGKPTLGLENTFITRYGEIRTLLWNITRLVDAAGEPSGVLGIAQDITERKMTEEALRASEARFRSFVHHAPDVIIITSREGVIRFINHVSPEHNPEQIIGSNVKDWVTPEAAKIIEAALEKAWSTGQPVQYEVEGPGVNGGTNWYGSRVSPISTHDGQATDLILIARDITERRQEEDRKARDGLLLAHVDDSVVVTDLDGKITYWNNGATKLYGFKSEEIIGKSAGERFPEPLRSQFMFRRENLLRGENFKGEFQSLRKDGTHVWVEGFGRLVYDAAGHPVGIMNITRDITERKAHEERQKLLMNELDHRVKNNLASVLGISRQTMATSTSLEHFRSAFEGRLKAMARTHDALAGNRWMGVVLYDIAHLVLKPYMDNEHSRFTIWGDDLVILPRSVMPLSLSLHELAINASKYGSLTSPTGRVSVHWTIKNSDLVIDWTETGGPPAQRPVRPGTGLSLIEGLVSYELRGSVNIEFLPTGFRCMLVVPSSEAVFSLDDPVGPTAAESPNPNQPFNGGPVPGQPHSEPGEPRS